jgi:hypothetical protein
MRNLILFVLLLLIVSCSKDESESDFVLEETFGLGSVYDAEIASDTSFILVGESDNNPLFIKTVSESGIDINYSPEYTGCFTEVTEAGSIFILGGYSDGNIVIAGVDNEGVELWDTVIAVTPEIGVVQMCEYDEDLFLLIGSSRPDSLDSPSFICVLFSIDGLIHELSEASPGFNASVTDLTIISPAEIFVSLTKNTGGENSKASIARITAEGTIIWETELFNNKDYAAGSLAIEEDGGSLYVAGRTEYNSSDGKVTNSFAAALSHNGMVTWKKYLENSNTGTDIAFDSNMNLVMLNQNCLILTGITLPDGTDIAQTRVLDVCDSYDTQTFGRALALTYENNYLIAGSRDNKFYYALKYGNLQ